jgi:hypothetical protein
MWYAGSLVRPGEVTLPDGATVSYGYDPTTGHFLSQGPAGVNTANPVKLDRYVYAADNPTTLSDPSGQDLVRTVAADINDAEVRGATFEVGSSVALLFIRTVLYATL